MDSNQIEYPKRIETDSGAYWVWPARTESPPLQVQLEFGEFLYETVLEQSEHYFVHLTRSVQSWALDRGLCPPVVEYSKSSKIHPQSYKVSWQGKEVSNFRVESQAALLLGEPDQLEPFLGLPAVDPRFRITGKVDRARPSPAGLRGRTWSALRVRHSGL